MTKQELAAKIWATANELRKNIKASEYKDYIIGFMFYKYLCDKEIDYLHTLGGEEEDLKDADEATKSTFKDGIGYFIPYDNLFSTWKKAGTNLGAKDVSESIDAFYLNLNDRYKVVFSNIFSALQSGVSKLGENSGSRDQSVRDIVDLVDLIPPTSTDYDVLGYIYEYLIQQFSSEAKKDGAFYTPHELTSLMSRIVAERLKDHKEICCYDPTVGSAGLLLNIGKEAERYIPHGGIKYFGQELITETANLAKMNLFMQGVPVQNINMRNANTLADDWPYFDEQTAYAPLFVDAVVSNPPYSAHYKPEEHQTDERFKGYGLAPAGKADYAFLLHCLYHIKSDGIMAIVLPHGVLFRGASEGEIRKNLILNHNIETIISLPANLFFATGIPVIVMILSKNRASDDILFVDASQSFKKDKKQNVLKESDVQRIYDAVIARKDIPNFAHLASMEEIEANGYNLNVPRYVTASKTEEPYDLHSVMSGQISNAELEQFAAIWKQFPYLREKLFEDINGYNTIAAADCKETVFADKDVQAFIAGFGTVTASFRDYLVKTLIRHDADPSLRIAIANRLFESYKDQPLVDVYDVYQAFADNWNMIGSDLARIKAEGWKICAETEPNMVTKKDQKTKKTVEEQKGWKGKIMPFDLVKKTYFTEDFEKMTRLSAEADAASAEYAELWENLEDDIKADLAKEDDETAFELKKFKAAIKEGGLEKETVDSLNAIQEDVKKEKDLRKQIKTIAEELDNKAKAKIESLTEDEICDLLEKKWIDPVITDVSATGNSVLNQFVSDLDALKKKYAYPMDELETEIITTEKELLAMTNDLTGDASEMLGLDELKKILGGV